MSVVAVKIGENKIKIAADSIIAYGLTKIEKTTRCSKLFKSNGMIIGGVGKASETLLLENFCSTHKPIEPTEREILNFFIEFNKYLIDLGLPKFTNDFIICYKRKAFQVSEDFFIAEINEYAAIGAGMDYSLAALYLGHTAQEAVQVACDLCAFVSSPIIEYEMDL